jgi:hypothetical protein
MMLPVNELTWRIKKLLSRCLQALAALQESMFVNYLRSDYIKCREHYQKVLNKKSKLFFSAMLNTSNAVQHFSAAKDIFLKINHLSEIIFSLNQLRFRVEDYTTFKVCAQEMQAIEASSIALFRQLAKGFFQKIEMDFNVFEERIHAFENLYNRALQIVSTDPLVFMFFIQDLYVLNEEAKKLFEMIKEKMK